MGFVSVRVIHGSQSGKKTAFAKYSAPLRMARLHRAIPRIQRGQYPLYIHTAEVHTQLCMYSKEEEFHRCTVEEEK